MKKLTLDKMLKNGDLTQDEYDSFFITMKETNGELIGVLPNSSATRKYHLAGDLCEKDMVGFVKKKLVPPLNACDFDPVFRKYGMSVYGILDYWHWFTKDNITEYALSHGCKPIEEASELDLWKMIAITERYWSTFYSRLYHKE